VIPSPPIYYPDTPLPPPVVDNTLPPLPPGAVAPPIYIPPNSAGPGVPTQPIYLPSLPTGSTLVVPIPGGQPKSDAGGAFKDAVPAIAWRPGSKPVLVYVAASQGGGNKPTQPK
jgi:hypothetical protein